MRNDSLLVNGRQVAEPYAIPSGDTAHGSEFDQLRQILAHPFNAARYRPTFATWDPLFVPGHAYFLLGDDRGNSLDSRFIGPVAVDSVEPNRP
jgi:signal peptidase I